jgi:hypothetical protein
MRLGLLAVVSVSMAGLGAKLDELVAVNIGLAFGEFGPDPQVGAQFVTGVGGLDTEVGQHLFGISADLAGLA